MRRKKPKAAYAAGDGNTAFCFYGIAAREGDADSQLMYGGTYFHYHKYQQAAIYLELAVRQGNSDAAKMLALLYKTGNGVQQDEAKAEILASPLKAHYRQPCDENNPGHLSGDEEVVNRALKAARGNDEAEGGRCWIWIGAAEGATRRLFTLGAWSS